MPETSYLTVSRIAILRAVVAESNREDRAGHIDKGATMRDEGVALAKQWGFEPSRFEGLVR